MIQVNWIATQDTRDNQTKQPNNLKATCELLFCLSKNICIVLLCNIIIQTELKK